MRPTTPQGTGMGRRAPRPRALLCYGAARLAGLAGVVLIAAGRWRSSAQERRSTLGDTLFVSARRVSWPSVAPPHVVGGEGPATARGAVQLTREQHLRPKSLFQHEIGRSRAPVTPKMYKVCYESLEEATRAVELLDGTQIDGNSIQVTLDDFEEEECIEDDHVKVNIQGVSPYTDQTEVEEHMAKAGKITQFAWEKEWYFGQVRFADPEDAWNAKVEMDGTTLMGKRIRTELDCSVDHLNSVLVHGVQRQARWQDLQEAFKAFGAIKWVSIEGGPKSARITFSGADGARRAVTEFNKKKMPGQDFYLYTAYTYDSKGTLGVPQKLAEVTPVVVRVQNVPRWMTEDQLREYFTSAGEVLSVEKEDPDKILPPEFMTA